MPKTELVKEKPMQENVCDKCYEPLGFLMEDEENRFVIGLLTVLECLQLAETEGHLPELPNDWWSNVNSRYRSS